MEKKIHFAIAFTLWLLVFIPSTALYGNTCAKPVNISGPNVVASDQKVASNNKGKAAAVWSERLTNSANSVVYVSTYDHHSKMWSKPFLLSTGTENSSSPDVSVDPAGNIYVIWANISQKRVEARIFNEATKMWSATHIFPTETVGSGQGSYAPKIRTDSKGNATAAWIFEANMGSSILETSNYDITSNTWSTPTSFSNLNLIHTVEEFDLAKASNGNATIAWRGDKGYILGSTFDAISMAWSPEVVLFTDTATTPDTSGPRVAVDKDGNSIVVFSGTVITNTIPPMTSFQVQGVTYDVSSKSWSLPITLFSTLTEGAVIDSPRVAMNEKGDIVVAWRLLFANFGTIQGRIFNAASKKWFPDLSCQPTILSGRGPCAGSASEPEVAITNFGNAAAVWVENDVVKSLTFDRFEHAWSKKATILSCPQSDSPQISVSGFSFFIVWDEVSLNNVVQAVLFSPVTITEICPLCGTPGAIITIEGKNLSSITSILFNGEPAKFKLFGKNKIMVTVPESLRECATIEIIGCGNPGPYKFQIIPFPPENGRIKKTTSSLSPNGKNIIEWSAPSKGTMPVSYRVYVDSSLTKLIGEVDGFKELKVIDYFPSQRPTYYIVSVDDVGGMSIPEIVSCRSSSVKPEK